MVKVDEILYHPLIVLHLKSFELVLHISFRVVRSKVAIELRGEFRMIGDPI